MIWEDSHDIGGDLAAYQDVCISGLDLTVTIAGKLGFNIGINTTTKALNFSPQVNSTTEYVK